MQNSTSKIALSASLIGLALITVMPVAANEDAQASATLTVVDCPLEAGKPYKKEGSSTVFVVTEDCKKRPVFNPQVYFSHYTGWDEITTVEAAALASIADHPLKFMPWGKRKAYKSGSLVKTVDNPKVFLIVDGKAYPIQSENAFKGLGFSFDKIEDVTADVLAKFQLQADAIEGTDDVPVSLVFKYPGEPKVYVLQSEDGVVVKSHIADWQTLVGMAKPDSIAVLPAAKMFADAKKGEVTYKNPEYKYAAPDAAAPVVSITAPAEGATLTGTATISANATDDKAVAWVKFKIGDKILAIDEAAPYETTVDTSKFPNGDVMLYVMAGDADGKHTLVSRPVTLSNGDIAPPAPAPKPTPDATNAAPTVSFTSPEAGATLSGMVTVTASASDDKPVAWVKFKVGDTILGIDETAPYSMQFDSSAFPNGAATLRLMVGDTGGKYGDASRGVTLSNADAPSELDRTPPTVTFDSPDDGDTLSGTVMLSATATDASGVSWVKFRADDVMLGGGMDHEAPYAVQFDTTAFPNGSLSVQLYSGDIHDNYSAPITRTYIISNPN